MSKTQTKLTPEQILDAVLSDKTISYTLADLRLLASGMAALSKAEDAPMNKNELTSISALIAYAAYTNNIPEEEVTSELYAAFGTKDIRTLPSKTYDGLVRCLVDLKIETGSIH